jgi:hypothetical protein
MANYVTTTLKATNNPELSLEFIPLLERYGMVRKYAPIEPNEVVCKEGIHVEMVDEILRLTKAHPDEEFILTHVFEHNNNSVKHIYRVKDGEAILDKYDPIYYMDDRGGIYPPEDAELIIDEGLQYLSKLDKIDEHGKITHCPHKLTIEAVGESYKVVVSKQDQFYWVEKFYKKEPSFKWVEVTPADSLP